MTTSLPAWATDPQAATPPLDEYLAAEEEEPNLFWMIGCGHHENLLEEAVDQRDEWRDRVVVLEEEARTHPLAAEVARLRELVKVNFDLYHEAMENWRAAAAERDELRVRIQLLATSLADEVDDK